jgi:hypothetical protein
MSNMSETIVNYTDFTPANLSFTKLEENDRSNGQLVGYPRYNGATVDLQLPWIKLFTYGVPQLGQYYKSDADRSHLRIPLDVNNPEVAEFINKIKELDTLMASPDMGEKLFGKKAKKYRYTPIFREGHVPVEESDDEDEPKKAKKPSAPRPPYIKAKLNLTYPERNIKTKVFESELNSETNKRTRTKLESIVSIDDFANIVRYQSNVRCIIRPFKIWAHSLTKKDPEFGISLRLERIEVDKSSIAGAYKSAYTAEEFIDSDDEEELPKIEKVAVSEPVAASKKAVVEESDSSDDEPVIKATAKVAEVASSDDSDSDDEPVVKAPSKAKKPVAKSKK